MPSDLTKSPNIRHQGYGPPVLQQGRVFLDRDFNALQETLSDNISADALEIIGPFGTPDNGFEIDPTQPSPPFALWSPPPPASPPANESFEFFIGTGTMYVGGQRAILPAHAPGQPAPLYYSYYDQPDWLSPTPPSSDPTQEAISLVLREQEISAVEDPDLLDVALGGPDTSQRLRLMRRIERTKGNTCSAPAEAWAARGFELDPKNMRLLPQVKLQVGLIADHSQHNPCDPVASGGYLGAYNQLIRVQVRQIENNGSIQPRLIWGYDNASFIYRVTVDSDLQTLHFAQQPVDAFHRPSLGQVVEVLRTASVLASEPDATDPTQQRKILRCVAEATGFITTLATSYTDGDPNTGGTVQLSDPLPADFPGGPQLFLRIWESQSAVNLNSANPIPLTDNAGNSTGLQVTLTVPAGATVLPDGAYWMVAVRPGTPQAVYPERFLTSPQAPDGPRQWLCPLAVIDWTGSSSSPAGVPAILHDCRNKFCDLVCLTKRARSNCCTFRVGDGVNTFGDFTSINDAIAHLPKEGGEICVLPGRYFEQVVISWRTDIVIHGCGQETRIASPSLQPGGNQAPSTDPVIAIKDSQHIELRSFVVEADQGSIGIFLDLTAPRILIRGGGTVPRPGVADVVMLNLVVIGSDQSAVSMNGDSLRLEDSIIAMQPMTNNSPAVFADGQDVRVAGNWVGLLGKATLSGVVQDDMQPPPVLIAATTETNVTGRTMTRGGIQIGGSSKNVDVVCNEIQGGCGNGITLGSLELIGSGGKPGRRFVGWTFYPPRNPCSGGTIVIPPTVGGGPNGPGKLVVEGQLTNIHLEHNRILDMGLAGIGAVGFFNLEDNAEVVSVTHLFILQNEIIRCLNQELVVIEDADRSWAAYAGIMLADVSTLVLRDNQIVDLGTSLSDGAYGIFLLHGEGVEISRNRITDMRDWTSFQEVTSSARGGICIQLVTPPAISSPISPAKLETLQRVSVTNLMLYMSDVPALTLFDNLVKIPVGPALLVLGLGTFSIRGNQFATGGLAGSQSIVLGACVEIFNVGTALGRSPTMRIADLLAVSEKSRAGLTFTDSNSTTSNITQTAGQGSVLFSQNRCWADLSSERGRKNESKVLSSVLIAAFDDLGFHDNQCALICSEGQAVLDALLIAFSLRANSNRFEEYPRSLSASCLTIASANITALNMSNNRVIPVGTGIPISTGVNDENF